MKYSELYKKALFQDILPFWVENSVDWELGGYFTCLDRTGQVYDSDKFIWLQGRQAWMFSMLYNQVESKEEWLEIARNGIDFLMRNGADKNGNFFFSLSRDGRPLLNPYNIFSDCFAAMAFAQYGKASGNEETLEWAKKTYENILSRKDNPKGHYEKSTGFRPLKNFALPMILSNLVLEMEDVLSHNEIERTLDAAITEVMDQFLHPSTGLIYENIRPDGNLEDSFDGRLLNPGHGIEAMWFMIDIGVRRGDSSLIKRASETIVNILEFSWDKEYGGIFYFMDSKGHPPQQLEYDQKLWWVHLESLVALAKAYEQTYDKAIWQWFLKVHEYTWNHFPDPEHGEWFGYLNRRGEPHLTLKGGKWKGCFHVPRALYQCWKTFERIENQEKKSVDATI